MLRRSALASPLGRRASKLFVALVVVGLIWTVGPSRAAADQRFVVRTADQLDSGLIGGVLQPTDIIGNACAIAGCTVGYILDGQIGQLFLVTTGDGVDGQSFLTFLAAQPGIVNTELDQMVRTLGQQCGAAGPQALYDRHPVEFYGTLVWHGYLGQPAVRRLGIQDAQDWFGLTGWDVMVAVIDTGVDPSHPVLQPVLDQGYDFTRDRPGGSERADIDVNQSTMAVVDQADVVVVNQSTMAVVDQSTMAVVDDEAHVAFGHGTMVAGVIHLVAPEARILPLKAFKANGTGYSSDILRAMYYAVDNGAKVLNLSFSYQEPSAELASAVQFAVSQGALVVASAGNAGQHAPSYPGALAGVIGVASATDADAISEFSNYGEDLFWIAAPGEGIVTTYPLGTYAATSGTSFSAPLAAGTAALLAQMTPWIDQEQAREAVGKATPIPGVARGRLDVSCAVSSQAQPWWLCTPSITWSDPADIASGTPLSAVQLNATASVPGTFTYTPAVGTVLSVGAAQTLRVEFTPTHSENYGPASASVSINVVKATPILTWNAPADIVVGTALGATQLNATASVPGTFAYTPPAGTVLNIGSGQTLSVTFTPTDNANYTGATATVAISVKGTPTIAWSTPADIVYGTALGAMQLNATASVPGTFTYTPAAGTLLNAGTGQTLRVAFTPTDTNYTAVARDVQINVLKATPTLTWSTPADIVYGTALGPTQLNATASVPGTFTYTPAASTLLTAGTGHTLHVAFTPTGTNHTAAASDVQINVLKATPTLTWPSPADIAYGTPLSAVQLNATASVSGTFTYTPAAGTILNAGTGQMVQVAFTPTDGTNYGGATASVAINVVSATPTLTWTAPADIVYGTALDATQLSATASVPGTFTYTPAAGTLLPAGTRQTLRVAFTPIDPNYTAVARDVQINVLKATPTLSWSTPADIAYGTALDATQLNATASVPGTFTYTPAAGTVLTAGTGQMLRVAFTPTDEPNYSGATASVAINVVNATPTLTWTTPADIVYGTALDATQLNATASVPGTFTYTPAAGTLLSAGTGQMLRVAFTPTDTNYTAAAMDVQINVLKATPTLTWTTPTDIAYGTALDATQLNATASVPGTFTYTPAAGTVLTAGTGQMLRVAFTPTDEPNYSGATASVAINVVNATPTLTWTTPADIVYGTALDATQLNATASVPGTFAYTPAAGTLLSAGTGQMLRVAFTPTDTNYTAAAMDVQISVLKATPTLTWTTSADIAYGTALDATQLNATASVPGTFAYTPPAGTILNAGSGQTLSVIFTPTDTANYTGGTASVPINVTPAGASDADPDGAG